MQATEAQHVRGLAQSWKGPAKAVVACLAMARWLRNGERDDDPSAQAKGALRQAPLFKSRVMNCGCSSERLLDPEVPEHALLGPLLTHAPWVERAQGTHDVRHTAPPAGSGGRQ